MLLVILGISLGLVVLGFVLWETTSLDGSCFAIGTIGGCLSAAALIAILVLSIMCSSNATVDERITMYQEENARIEEQVADIVTQYQQYEKDIFTEVTPDSSVVLVSLYPELKSDTLVASLIEIYVENNETIKELKEESIYAGINRWWLYFGK